MPKLRKPEAVGNEGLASLQLHVLPPLPRHKERERRCAMEAHHRLLLLLGMLAPAQQVKMATCHVRRDAPVLKSVLSDIATSTAPPTSHIRPPRCLRSPPPHLLLCWSDRGAQVLYFHLSVQNRRPNRTQRVVRVGSDVVGIPQVAKREEPNNSNAKGI